MDFMKNMPIKNLLLIGLFISSHSFGSQMAPSLDQDNLKKGALGLATVCVATFMANRFMAAREMRRQESIIVSLPKPMTEEEIKKKQEQATDDLKKLYQSYLKEHDSKFVFHNKIPEIRTLLEAQADPNIYYLNIHDWGDCPTPLVHAVEYNIPPLVKLLLHHKANLQGYELSLTKNIQTAQLLLDAKAESNGNITNVLYEAVWDRQHPSWIALYSKARIPATVGERNALGLLCLQLQGTYAPKINPNFLELYATLVLQNPALPFICHLASYGERFTPGKKTPTEILKNFCPQRALQAHKLNLEIQSIYTDLPQQKISESLSPFLSPGIQQIIVEYLTPPQIGKSLSLYLSPSDVQQIVIAYLAPQLTPQKKPLTLREAQALINDTPDSDFFVLKQLDPSKLEEKQKKED